MSAIARVRRMVVLLSALCVVIAILPTGRVSAAPGDDEGGTPSLREVLDVSLKDYNDAKGRLDASAARQATLIEQMQITQVRLTLLQAEVGTVAAAAYRTGRLNMATAVLGSDSPDALLHTAAMVNYLAWRDDQQLRELTATRRTLTEQQAAIQNEVQSQQQQLTIMTKRKDDALAALAKTGGGQLTSGVIPGKATATQSPRNADGSWPPEGCTLKDPTPTSGCVTPRMKHAYDEARLAGFTRFTSCYRPSGSGEHPKGRACDFSATVDGFVDARAAGTDKVYGDRLAGWCIANASRLGVLYVIWYKQIWFPDRGWRSYSGDGTPAGDHYNHVHLSVQ
jgi:hypothetical protein